MRQRGFTLIEVMIALAIFAVVATALIKGAALSVAQTEAIQDRSVAWWMAENTMTELRLQPRSKGEFPSTGMTSKQVSAAGWDWEVETRFETTDNKNVRRVEIIVYRPGYEDAPSARLVGFLGKH